jgi:hypothetical protein
MVIAEPPATYGIAKYIMAARVDRARVFGAAVAFMAFLIYHQMIRDRSLRTGHVEVV